MDMHHLPDVYGDQVSVCGSCFNIANQVMSYKSNYSKVISLACKLYPTVMIFSQFLLW